MVFLGTGLDLVDWHYFIEKKKINEVLEKLDSALKKKALKRVEWQSGGNIKFLMSSCTARQGFHV